ncbi:sigma factor [Streptomyces sp. NPDC046862]|uniref:RNA polymerase sigma factor n=1 Tax=Streptomyces sp. NPDC046862 TaxID=3154603 RepID=UPI003454FB94
MGRRGHAQRVSAEDAALTTAVARAQDGDEAAYTQVYRLIQPGLLGYIRGIVGDGADDLAAAVWREIARELPGFRGDGPGLRGWTASIARRHVLGHLRHHGTSPRSPGNSSAPTAGCHGAHAPPAATLSAGTAQALLARLPLSQAEAVLLHHAVCLDEPAVARVMRRPRPVIRVLTRRGVNNLARMLNPNDVTHDVARTLRETG